MKKSLFTVIFIVGIIYGCAQTPNSISLSASQGQCVTGTFPGYESVATISAAFPMNANLPANSPYCMAFTLVNSNSGANANNVQVSGYGLSLSYTVGKTTYSGSLIDFNAAGVSPGAFTNTFQQIGNIALFDPGNCVTTLGANVNTLNANGGSCTFYVQITSESMPVGVYPLNFTVNYTNGNANYSTGATIKQRSNLYVGGNFSSNLLVTNAQNTTPANTLISANYPGSVVVTALARDAFGNVYSGDQVGNVYYYNGESRGAWTQITGLPASGGTIAAMTADSAGNTYLVNAQGQVYQLDNESNAITVNSMGTLSAFNATAISSMQAAGTTSQLQVSNASNIYDCSLTSASCNASATLFPNGTINQLLFSTNTMNVAGESQVYSQNGVNWITIPNTQPTGLPGTVINAIAYFNSTSSSGSIPYWYASTNQLESSISSVYVESGTNAAFTTLLSTGGQNFISSVAKSGMIADNAQGIFVSGALFSGDFSGQQALAYLVAPVIAESSVWTPITGANGVINAMQGASQLTSY